jgi:hypothetical protein
METSDPAESARAFRLNITVKPETKSRLDEARNKKRIDLNISQICDRAINAELDRADQGEVAEILARLKVESDRRRGRPYRLGHEEGTRWARDVGSWAEICKFAAMVEADVRIGTRKWTWTTDGEERVGEFPAFVGGFVVPHGDYGQMRPGNWGAPAFRMDDAWVRAELDVDQYWRGWLRGVLDVFDLVGGRLEPIGPDPDEIPF